jgi:hypothetical protein
MRIVKGDLSNFGIMLTPAPRVQVSCYIVRLNLSTEVDFLIDTGAEGTCLNGGYAIGLQKYMKKKPLLSSTGIGGKCGYYTEKAVLVFNDINGQPLGIELNLGIQCIRQFLWMKPNITTLRTPCLLGRDILSKWEFQYDHQKNNVKLIAP